MQCGEEKMMRNQKLYNYLSKQFEIIPIADEMNCITSICAEEMIEEIEREIGRDLEVIRKHPESAMHDDIEEIATVLLACRDTAFINGIKNESPVSQFEPLALKR
jgi:hypothetical protein